MESTHQKPAYPGTFRGVSLAQPLPDGQNGARGREIPDQTTGRFAFKQGTFHSKGSTTGCYNKKHKSTRFDLES